MVLISLILCLGGVPMDAAGAKSCVWKVSSGEGRTLYLAGSVHALRASDYPLPAAYDQAFAASQELLFETEPGGDVLARMSRMAELPRGVTLRERVDPRTYAYLQRVLARTPGATAPEKKIERLRPWALGWLLESPAPPAGLASRYGVDAHLYRKARQARKPTGGLVSLDEHAAVFGGMSDADGEVYLLLQFIGLNTAGEEFARLIPAWRRGDAAFIDATMRRDYRDAPGIYRRLLSDRNRRWLPKIEGYLRPDRDGKNRTRMIVAGAAHMAGDEGLPALLRARGYQVEQL